MSSIKINTILSLLFIVYFVNPTNAAKKGDYIVTLDKDTLSAVFKAPGWDNIVCIVNGEKKKYSPENILGYRYDGTEYESAFVAKKEKGKKKWYFLKKITSKKMIFLELTEVTNLYPSGTTKSYFYYSRRPNQTRDEIQSIYDDITRLYDVCSDCPKLIDQIKSKEWSGGLYNALIYYVENQNCN